MAVGHMLHTLRRSRSVGAFASLLLASWLWGIGLSSSHGHDPDQAYSASRLSHRSEPVRIGAESGAQGSSTPCVICQYLRSLRTSLQPPAAPACTLHSFVLVTLNQPDHFGSAPAVLVPERAPPTA